MNAMLTACTAQVRWAAGIARELLIGRICHCISMLALVAAVLITAGAETTFAATAPALSKSFGAPSLRLGDETTLTFVITNPNFATSLSHIAFTDVLPAGLRVAQPNGLNGSCGSGTIAALAGFDSISLSGGTLNASGTCIFSVGIVAVDAGTQNNTTSAITSQESGSGGAATATITVVSPPATTKAFSGASVPLYSTTPLSFSLTNTNAGTSLSGVGLTDTFPHGFVVATPNGLIGSCPGGTITATAGSDSVSLSGLTLAPNASCTFSVNIIATADSAGININEVIANSNEGGQTGASATVHVNAVTHDFNKDTASDILWRQNGGAVALWLMNRSQIVQAADVATVPTTWSIVGQRDFNGDGTADLLWRDTSGNLAIWFMDGTLLTGTASLGTVPTNWTISGTPSFYGVQGNLLWRDSNTGTVALWIMNGAAIAATANIATVPTSWNIIGSDANGDILWRDTSGNLAMWQLSGTQVFQTAGLGNLSSNWVLAGLGDFNGDGTTDILWREVSTGTLGIWFLSSTLTVQSTVSLGAVPLTWNVVQTGDYNGDATSDILWIDSAGNLAMWFMNGGHVASTASLGNVGTTWTVRSMNAE